MDEQTKQHIEQRIREHEHDGNQAMQIKYDRIFNTPQVSTHLRPATIGTAAGNNDDYVIVPITGIFAGVDFSAVDALATSDTNFITWTITNLGQAGAGSTALLAAGNGNTTKTTGGSAIAANTKRALSITTVVGADQVAAGDRLRIRAAVTGTLANTVAYPAYILRFT